MTTVYITYKSGRKETYSGMTGPFTRNAHFTGTAAAAAGELFHIGINNNESFGSALLGALVAGDMLSHKGGMMDSANHFAPQNSNPNCFQNAIKGSPGIGRGVLYYPDTGSPDDIASHDGWHTLSTKEGGMARTLAPLTGNVIGIVRQSATDPKTLWNVYVKADGKIGGAGFYIAYKDFPSRQSIVAQMGQHLGVNDPIGTVRPAGDPRNQFGLHITLVRAQYWKNFRDDKITKAKQGRQMESGIRRGWIIDPNSKESPINCLK